MTDYKGMFIDDSEKDGKLYSKILNTLKYPYDSKLVVKPETVTEFSQMINRIVNSDVEILFLDYRLDEILVDKPIDNSNSYKGGGLAQAIREEASSNSKESYSEDLFFDLPIILISSEDYIERLYEPEQTTHDLFDAVYSKERIGNDDEQHKLSKKFYALIIGYKELVEYVGNNDSDIFKVIFKIDNDDIDGLKIVNQQEIVKP